MSLKLLFLYTLINRASGVATDKKFCVVDAKDPAIYLNATEGKNRFYKNSTFVHSIILRQNLEVENWRRLSAYQDPENFRLGIVLDWRWENFPDNTKYPRQITRLLNRANASHNFFLSVKLYNTKEEWLTNLGFQNYSWIHMYKNSSHGLSYLHSTGSRFSTIEENINLWKLFSNNPKWIWKGHAYKYLWTNLSHTAEILKYIGTDRNSSNSEAFIYIFLAMCSSCQIAFEVRTEADNYTKNVTNVNKWEEISIHLDHTPLQFTLWAITTARENSYWAIGDIRYSHCPDDQRYIEIEDTDHVNGCELVLNSSVIIPTEHYLEDCKTQELTTPDFQSTTNPAVVREEPSTTTTNLDGILHKNSNTESNTNDPADVAQTGFNYVYLAPIFLAIIAAGAFFAARFIYKRRRISRTLVIPSDEDLELVPASLDSIPDAGYHPIKMNNFGHHVKMTLDKEVDILTKQFYSIPNDYRLCEDGNRVVNRSKNRKSAVIPFDETRVVLAPYCTSATNFSNYINASYVEGFQNKTEYIITQNPILNEKVSTVADFWHMVWQTGVQYIVMISSQLEDEYDQYWPELNQRQTHGYIELCLVEVEEHEYFVERLIEIVYLGKSTKIRQYHYSKWAPPGKPMHPFKVIPFLNKVLQIPHMEVPILIHSKTGNGRSGVIIAVDVAIRACQLTGTIDLFQVVKSLRHYRMNIVKNLDEYKLVHLLVLEYLIGENTTLDLDDIFPNYKKLNELWNYLNKIDWIDGAVIESKDVNSVDWKNRYEDCLPVSHSRVILKHISPNYINATYVKAYKGRRFITTQQPLPKTLQDFWIMLLQNKVGCIVNLNEIDEDRESSCKFWPTQDQPVLKPLPDVHLYFKEMEDFNDYSQYFVDVHQEHKYRSTVVILAVKNWFGSDFVPSSPDILLRIWSTLKTVTNPKSTTVVTCDDGINACGLFVCLAYLLEKMEKEGRCDLVAAVRTVRASHNKYINKRQFDFLFETVMAMTAP